MPSKGNSPNRSCSQSSFRERRKSDEKSKAQTHESQRNQPSHLDSSYHIGRNGLIATTARPLKIATAEINSPPRIANLMRIGLPSVSAERLTLQ